MIGNEELVEKLERWMNSAIARRERIGVRKEEDAVGQKGAKCRCSKNWGPC